MFRILDAKLQELIWYIEYHPGMPLAVLFVALAGALFVDFGRSFRLVDPLLLKSLALIFALWSFMVGFLGWLYDSLIASLNDEPDVLRQALGFDSWIVIYLNNGEFIPGTVEMDREQAAEWAKRSPVVAAIMKKRGPFKRVVSATALRKQPL